MAHRLDSLTALNDWPFDEVIDVRSPAEFAEDHIPGALSLPVLSDAERAEVGTIYTRQDPFLARKVGAALVAANAAAHLQGPLADRPGHWRPLVYCWRGGQRSASFASILAQIGWRVDIIEGGYQAYRRLVVKALYDDAVPHRLVLIDGGTGTAKTRLLERLAGLGAQVVDLEALAGHRGSLFGAYGAPQPAQKMFETRLAQVLAGLDPARPVFAEAEGNKIGNLLIPPSLWKKMQKAPHVQIAAPLAARADFLLHAYGDLVADPDLLAARLDKLRAFHGAEQTADWQALAAQGDFHALAMQLIERHYDPRYAKAALKRAQCLAQLDLSDLTEPSLADAAADILRLVSAE